MEDNSLERQTAFLAAIRKHLGNIFFGNSADFEGITFVKSFDAIINMFESLPQDDVKGLSANLGALTRLREALTRFIEGGELDEPIGSIPGFTIGNTLKHIKTTTETSKRFVDEVTLSPIFREMTEINLRFHGFEGQTDEYLKKVVTVNQKVFSVLEMVSEPLPGMVEAIEKAGRHRWN